MEPANLLFILSDQHNVNVLGCYGNPVVQTPHLDRLAERGTRFASAYTNCPICVPARASLATGRYVHQIGNWDNAFPYDGSVASWGHRLKAQDYRIDSIGKLHFRGGDDNGFSEEIDPLNVVDGVGDLLSCLRENPPRRNHRPSIDQAGPGDSTYLRYDASNTAQAIQWLEAHARDERPWVLFLSLVCPHPPYIAPPEFYARYAHEDMPLPPQWQANDWPHHPALDYLRWFFHEDEPFNEATLRQFNATYYAVCSYLDDNIGKVLRCVEQNGLSDGTRVIYTSDHGESLGARGLTGKFTMYQESAAIPFIMAGPDVPEGLVVQTPISLVDCYPTILEAVGADISEADENLLGDSLWSILRTPESDRTVFSEYHAVGSRNGYYMLRDRQYKYVYYVDAPPQLFDLIADPDEINDLVMDSGHEAVLRDFEARLRVILDPEGVDMQAKADQRAKIEAFGGEEVVRKRGTFTNSPVPGEEPGFQR